MSSQDTVSTFITRTAPTPTSLPLKTPPAAATACSQWTHIKCSGSYTHLFWVMIPLGILLFVLCLAAFVGYFVHKTRAKKSMKRDNSPQVQIEMYSGLSTVYTSVNKSMNNDVNGIPRRNSVGSISDVATVPRILMVMNPDDNDTSSVVSIEQARNIYDIQEEEKGELELDVGETSEHRAQEAHLMIGLNLKGGINIELFTA